VGTISPAYTPMAVPVHNIHSCCTVYVVEFVNYNSFIWVQMQLFLSYCAGNTHVQLLCDSNPGVSCLEITYSLVPVLSVFLQHAFCYCLECNLLLENFTRICTLLSCLEQASEFTTTRVAPVFSV
jgi:hypothetical protein